MNFLHISMMCCLPNPKSRPSIRVVKQVIKELENLSNNSITMVNLISYLPLKRPTDRYSLIEVDTQAIQDNSNNSLSKHQYQSHRRRTQSPFTSTRMGHALPQLSYERGSMTCIHQYVVLYSNFYFSYFIFLRTLLIEPPSQSFNFHSPLIDAWSVVHSM